MLPRGNGLYIREKLFLFHYTLGTCEKKIVSEGFPDHQIAFDHVVIVGFCDLDCVFIFSLAGGL